MSGFAQALNAPTPSAPATAYSSPEASSQVIYTSEATRLPGTPLLEGWELWIPPIAPTFVDGMPVYEIEGSDAQMVVFPLRPGRKIMCFSGAMCYMSDGMKMDAKLAGLGKTFGRLAGGGSIFQLTYTNETNHDGFISCTPDYPGVIVPIHMAECPSGKVIAQRDSFLCSTYGLNDMTTDVGAGFNPASSVAGFCCGGVDFIVQTISNGEWAFLMAMGTVVSKQLQPGETVLVDTDSVLCFESSVTVDVKTVGGFLTCCCSGEGLFNTTFTGPGKLWIQSMSIDKMRRLFPPKVQESGNDNQGGDQPGFDFN